MAQAYTKVKGRNVIFLFYCPGALDVGNAVYALLAGVWNQFTVCEMTTHVLDQAQGMFRAVTLSPH